MSGELPDDEIMRLKARMMYEDEGTLEIDDGCVVSRAEGNPDCGAFVAAWVWVPDPAINHGPWDRSECRLRVCECHDDGLPASLCELCGCTAKED